MPLELIFHGAAGAVTGSCMELRGTRHRVLVDCGLFQGSRTLETLNYELLPFDPRDLDLVVLTHAHLDHAGRLPLLVREGLRAPVLCLPPNRQLLGPLLMDAAKLQASDAERRNERPDRSGLPPFEPLYDFEDVTELVAQVETLRAGKWHEPLPGLELRFWDAHHILGAASVELRLDGQALLFSGDIGDGATKLADPPAPEGGWDHVVCEATYGDRDRVVPTEEARRERLAKSAEAALARGGNLVIPAFALQRTQLLIEDFVTLFDSGRLTPVPVFIDAPLADKVTRAYRRYDTPPRRGPSPFDHPKIRFTRSVDESKMLNRISGAVIIAGSGMCTGGRVRYHLLRNLPRADSTVLFVGYQARGTLGAVLESGARLVRISGADVRVRAHIESLDAYSAHADRAGLLRWIAARAPIRGNLFLDHGETPALDRLAADAAQLPGIPAPIVPVLGESFRLAPQARAIRSAAPRADAPALVAGEDLSSRQAALRELLDSRLAALPTDAARRAALDTVQHAVEALPR
ncbi:MBL fold metallo-hydrolase [Sphingomonas cannabina]|uniref:MBL fold metallo-hydrolase RNA specificity domain-containing protein n=1 Tax=Sphingomonas cannabina TaxID=2899123 RepID=UPI001F45B0E7|nr:MBL fold metallo-hydrolase [Sphingomonas cannabina]UIJ46335.1 MBL fold metallo-hydrolase [Sphingomonas cannabina]